MTTDILPLDSLTLYSGSHGDTFEGECCVVEASNLIAAGRVIAPAELMPPCPLEPAPFSDDHPSISRVIRAFVVAWNDALPDDDRQMLRPYAARILCTRTTDEDDETRAWMAIDWLARVHAPAWLRLAGLEDHARALESLARITDATLASSALPTLHAAESAAWSAAESAAESAARSAAWLAAGSAAWSAARSAARSAAWSAAESAARSAARSAAGDALRPTVEELQRSALGLLDAMIAVGRPNADGAA